MKVFVQMGSQINRSVDASTITNCPGGPVRLEPNWAGLKAGFTTLAGVTLRMVWFQTVRDVDVGCGVGARIRRGARFEHDAPMRCGKMGRPRPGTHCLSRAFGHGTKLPRATHGITPNLIGVAH